MTWTMGLKAPFQHAGHVAKSPQASAMAAITAISLFVVMVLTGSTAAADDNSPAFESFGRQRSSGSVWGRGEQGYDQTQDFDSRSSSSSSSSSVYSTLWERDMSPARPRRDRAGRGKTQQQRRGSRGRPKSKKPNVIVILTDDQDVLLGSLRYMPKVQRLLIRQGAFLNNSFVSTPMCCPSRSTFLTGLYVHNHNVYSNNVNCSGLQWQREQEPKALPNHVNSTHRTGYFGKYLNDYYGHHTPPGWDRWMGLIRNSRFYNYSLVDEKGRTEKHGDNYYTDYLTDLIAHRGTAWLRESKRARPTEPIMMVLSVPAPHGPEDSAPQYQHMFANNTDHRTPAWNHAPNPDKQWLLKYVSPMTPQFKLFTDMLQRKRLQTLQSVDDLVELVVSELDQLGELDNTYIVYTSDHGYHLGQYGLIKGKAMLFDTDTRVPLIIRGPGIPAGINISNIIINVDMTPTLIDMAGHKVPDYMDGQSIMRLLKASRDASNVDERGFVQLKKPWRDSVLFERGKLTEKILRERDRTEEMIIYNQAQHNKGVHFYIPSRKRKLAIECSKPGNRLPCQPQQKWYCIEVNGRLRKHKCSNQPSPNSSGIMLKDEANTPTDRYHSCPCTGGHKGIRGGGRRAGKKLGRKQRRKERRRNKRHLSRRAKRIKRMRRSVEYYPDQDSPLSVPVEFNGLEGLLDRRCRILANQSVVCDLDIYQKADEWATHKERIDSMIKEYRKALDDLRDIRRHLREQRPIDTGEDSNELGSLDPAVAQGEAIHPAYKGDCFCDADGNIIDLAQTDLSKSERRHLRKQLRKKKRKKGKKKSCTMKNMNCFSHDNNHWKTPPYWTYGPFCFCSNANNNTYWCMRTINETHDFVYCEFITTFMSFYDLLTDPHQLKNTVTELNYGILQQLHQQLERLKSCQGQRQCTLRSTNIRGLDRSHRTEWPGLIEFRRSKARRGRYTDNRDGTLALRRRQQEQGPRRRTG